MKTNNVDLFYDLVDRATMVIYEDLHTDYLTCLIKAGEVILGYQDNALKDDSLQKLNEVFDTINNNTFLNEEVRLALQLLIIKGFKHLQKYPIDLMTPDTVVFLFAYFINNLYNTNIKILDIALGTGNLINGISNFISFESELVGIEKEQKLVELAKVTSELQNNDLKIYLNNCLDPFYEMVDLVIGDLDSYFLEDKYFPYLVINKYLNNLNENGMFIYLISNDFFNQNGNIAFKEDFDGTLLGLIVLPETMFKGLGKSLLIGTKKKIEAYEMLVINMPSMQDQKKVKETIEHIYVWTQKLKGMII